MAKTYLNRYKIICIRLIGGQTALDNIRDIYFAIVNSPTAASALQTIGGLRKGHGVDGDATFGFIVAL